MKFIGITGGVGAGKSAVLNFISSHYNAKVVLADDLAKSLMEPQQECYRKITEAFRGYDILDEHQRINPSAMAELLFSDARLRKKMNDIVHPAVKDAVLRQVEEEKKKGTYDYFFFEAALLIEDGYDKLCDELWYIYTKEEKRRQRLKEGRGYSDEKIDAIFESQLKEDVFFQHCRRVIDNNGTPEETFSNMQKLLE